MSASVKPLLGIAALTSTGPTQGVPGHERDPTESTPRRPLQSGYRRQSLFAVTILLVEDSRSASEAIRLMAAESGARVRRADSLHAASRHLAIYRPNVVMVDLGLPDGDGMELIRHLAAATPPIGGVIALSGHDRVAWQAEALRSGAARLPREADPLARIVPGRDAQRAARRRQPPPGRPRPRRWPAAPRCSPPTRRTCAAPTACSPRRCRPATPRP